MKFRNFEKIGIIDEDAIKEFLGETIMSDFIESEQYIQHKIRKASDFYGKTFDDKQEIVVSLINEKCDTGNILVCIIEPYISVSVETVKFNYVTRDGLVERRQFPKFKAMEEAIEFTDKLYGATSHEDVSVKSQRLSGGDENS